MDSITTLGWSLLLIVALGAGFLGGAFLLYWYGRKQMVASLRYIVDRLKVVEAELDQQLEETYVMHEYLKSKDLLDDEDLLELRRELIDRPRQLEAERAELIQQSLDEDVIDRLVKNVPDTLH